jgi:hypothetical protein
MSHTFRCTITRYKLSYRNLHVNVPHKSMSHTLRISQPIYFPPISPRFKMPKAWTESDLNLALQAHQNNPNLSVRKAAIIYNVPPKTLIRRQRGQQPKVETNSQKRKLSTLEENCVVKYTLDLDSRSFPTRIGGVRDMADRLLELRDGGRVGKNWASNFIRRRPELKTRLNRRIDYQRVHCEDPDAYRAWFSLVRNTVTKYGVHEEDIYNFDETGFVMGQISSEIVVTTSDRRGRPRAVHQGNREWITVIQGVGSNGYALPPFIIVAGKTHLSSWYQDNPMPSDWVITVSESGWTTNEKGLEWIRHFDQHTKGRTKGAYRILILDGHESHHSVVFELYCKEHNIITLCMPAHSSHKLQPLDVGCFRPLKRSYGKQIEGLIRAHITHVSKEDFFPAFHAAFVETMTIGNIQGGFRGAGLVPYDPESVISQLDVKFKTPTPPGTSSGLPPAWESKTPNNPIEMDSQTEYMKCRLSCHQNSSPTPIIEGYTLVAKGAKQMAYENAFLRNEVANLRAANERLSKRRQTKKKQLRKGGSLSLEEARDILSQKDVDSQLHIETRQRGGRTRRAETRPRCCGICGEPGHNARTCENDKSESEESDSN